jgi:hypothetical protein
MWFKSNKKRLKELVNSDRYINSDYVIELHNNRYYVLKIKNNGLYVDLASRAFTWTKNEYWFKHCRGSIADVIKAFNYRVPIVEEINCVTTF